MLSRGCSSLLRARLGCLPRSSRGAWAGSSLLRAFSSSSSSSSSSSASSLAEMVDSQHNRRRGVPHHQVKPVVKRQKATLIRGDGIGPEVTHAVISAFVAMKAPVDWESFDLQSANEGKLSPQLIRSVRKNKFVLKGPLFTPMGHGHASPDVNLAREFGLFAHVVPVRLLEGVKTRHDDVDLVVIRENTEGEYTGLEHIVNDEVVQSVKIITEKASLRIAKFAFDYAVRNNRRKVTAVHKANIMKMADGLFLNSCRQVAAKYKDVVEFDEVIIDNCCMQLVTKPEQFDVMVTGNLYGNIVSESAAGLAGGVALVPGFNEGTDGIRVYEQGPRHIGMDIAGRRLANPTSFLLASAMMLRDMQLGPWADTLENAVYKTIREQKVRTIDLDGNASTYEFTQAVVDNMELPVVAPDDMKVVLDFFN